MPNGKFFFIRSKMNGKVLDVQAQNASPGTNVIAWDQKGSSNDNQLWYVDPLTRTIRSKLGDLCMEIDDSNTLIVNTPDPDNGQQKWIVSGDRITNEANSDRVIDVAKHDDGDGARICAWDFHGDDNQLWEFDHQEAQPFCIVSCMNGKVLDIHKKDKLVTNSRSGGPSQIWYEDETGVIHSTVNDFAFDSKKKGSHEDIRMTEFEPDNKHQMWVRCENRIVNLKKPDKVLDIKNAKDKDGAKVIAHPFHGGDHQLWEFDYIG